MSTSHPSSANAGVLETYLDLPENASKLAFAGPQSMHLDFRRPGTREHAQVLVRWDGAGGSMTWEPSGLRLDELNGTAWVVRHGEQTLISLPELRGTVSGGAGEGSFVMARAQGDHARRHRAVFRTRDLQVAPAVSETVRQVMFGDEPGPTRFGWGGELDAVLDFDPLDPGGAPHPCRTPAPARLGAGRRSRRRRDPRADHARRAATPLPRAGGRSERGSRAALRLPASTPNRWTEHAKGDEAEEPAPASIRVETVVDADPGIEMGERFSALLSPDAWAAIQRLGMTGCLGARALAIDLRVSPEAEIEFTMNGWVLPRHIRIQAPPRLEGGSAEFLVRDFRWRSPTEFDGEIRLEDGNVRVSGLQLDQAPRRGLAYARLDQLRRFVARTLDGRVFTRNPTSEAPEDQGIVRVGLTPDVPLRVQVWFDRLSLEAMRDELDLGGNLAGKLEGQLDLRSASVSPLDYHAAGWFEIADGVLGTVPVLASIWQFAGIDPPQFSEVRMEWRTHPRTNRGRVRIDSYELRNPALLEVTGDGWVGMDGELDLNARIRDLSVVGWLFELPIVVDLFDLLIEQNVYGPLERPRVVHRAADKLFSQRPETIPHPLWVPAPPRPDWRLSPAIPSSMLQGHGRRGSGTAGLPRNLTPQP